MLFAIIPEIMGLLGLKVKYEFFCGYGYPGKISPAGLDTAHPTPVFLFER